MIVTGVLLMTRASESPRSSGAESRNQSHVNAHTCATPTPFCACAAKNGPAHTRKNSICLHWVKLSLYQSDVRVRFFASFRAPFGYLLGSTAHAKNKHPLRDFSCILRSLCRLLLTIFHQRLHFVCAVGCVGAGKYHPLRI